MVLYFYYTAAILDYSVVLASGAINIICYDTIAKINILLFDNFIDIELHLRHFIALISRVISLCVQLPID